MAFNSPLKFLTSIKSKKLGLAAEGHLILNKRNTSGEEVQEVFGASKVITITSAQLLALNATPQPIIPALGAGLIAVPRRWAARKPAGTAYAGIAAGEDLTLRYTDGSGAQCASPIETTGFLDQTTAQVRHSGQIGAAVGTPASFTPVANAAVVVHLLSGEIITGDTALIVKVWYDVFNSLFTN